MLKIKKVDDKPIVIHTKRKTKDSIKKKDSKLKYVGFAGVKTATDQMEGGEEIRDSAMVAYRAWCWPVSCQAVVRRVGL